MCWERKLLRTVESEYQSGDCGTFAFEHAAPPFMQELLSFLIQSFTMIICWLNLRRIAVLVFIVNAVLTLFTVLIFFSKGPKSAGKHASTEKPIVINLEDDWIDTWGPGFPEESSSRNRSANQVTGQEMDAKSNQSGRLSDGVNVIEVWSKAAIGLFLWQHILQGKIDKNIANGMYMYGVKRFPEQNLKFKFRSGPSVTIESLRKFTTDSSAPSGHASKRTGGQGKNLILVLNGRDDEKIEAAEEWLKELQLIVRSRKATGGNQLNVAVIMLGKEDCFNNWILKYMSSRGGIIQFLFITYDWMEIDDDEIHQWPLGVATYRNFPAPDDEVVQKIVSAAASTSDHISRPYVCNFLGTIYANTTRQSVASVVKLMNEKYSFLSPVPCFLHERQSWLPSETRDSLSTYVQVLTLSDLTLNPIGRNHECYRIYEAMSLGSVPVLEESLDHVKQPISSCDQTSAYRLLKRYAAPIRYVKNWTSELPELIDREINLISKDEKIKRRHQLINWYQEFRRNMRDKLFDVLNRKFFQLKSLNKASSDAKK